MENLQKIRILNAFRAYLHNMRTNDTNGNFRDKSISLKIRQVGRIFVVSLALITPTFVIYLSVWYLIENNLSISEFSTSIALILAYVQFNFNGVAMMIKRNMIHVTMDNIQKTVDERELNKKNIEKKTKKNRKKIGKNRGDPKNAKSFEYSLISFWFFFLLMQNIHGRMQKFYEIAYNLQAHRGDAYNADAGYILHNCSSRDYGILSIADVPHFKCTFRVSPAKSMAAIAWNSVRNQLFGASHTHFPLLQWNIDFDHDFRSSLIDQNTYIEFLFNWCIESLSALCTANTFTAVTSLYVGLYLYIGGMLADLKAQMTSFDRKTTAESLEFRSIFVRAVQLHVDIIE